MPENLSPGLEAFNRHLSRKFDLTGLGIKIVFSYFSRINLRKHMIRGIFSFFLAFYTLVCFGQDKNVPAAIQVPQGSRLVLHTYAKGVQVYVSTPDPKDTSHYIWTFKEPRANLYADSTYHQLIGRHYFDAAKNPTWEDRDGSKVTGAKVQQANAPDALSIPWLLLKATITSGTGTLTSARFIQRIYTKGGKAPATADSLHKGQAVEVPYAAEYLFYAEK